MRRSEEVPAPTSLVINPFMPALESRPEGFPPVRVRHVANIFARAVPDRTMPVADAIICARLIGVHDRIRSGVIFDKSLQGFCLCSPYPDLFCAAITNARDRNLANRTTTGP